MIYAEAEDHSNLFCLDIPSYARRSHAAVLMGTTIVLVGGAGQNTWSSLTEIKYLKLLSNQISGTLPSSHGLIFDLNLIKFPVKCQILGVNILFLAHTSKEDTNIFIRLRWIHKKKEGNNF